MTTAARWGRAGLAVGAGLLLAACAGRGTGAQASGPTTSAALWAPTAGAAPATGSAPGGSRKPGCSPTGDALPAGASVAPTADLDHDGAPDELWLADAAGKRLLGVRTASGAVFSTAFDSAAPQRASAVGQELGPDLSIVLLDAGRSVPLYAVVSCALAPTQNAQGQQYTFDRGFTGYGTGVGCEPTSDGARRLDLYGLLAHQAGDGTWTVTGTRIDIGGAGRTATNGPSSDLTTGATADAAVIEAARGVTCGDQTTGPTEPES